MNFDLERILESKRALRRRVTAVELRMLDALRKKRSRSAGPLGPRVGSRLWFGNIL